MSAVVRLSVEFHMTHLSKCRATRIDRVKQVFGRNRKFHRQILASSLLRRFEKSFEKSWIFSRSSFDWRVSLHVRHMENGTILLFSI